MCLLSPSLAIKPILLLPFPLSNPHPTPSSSLCLLSIKHCDKATNTRRLLTRHTEHTNTDHTQILTNTSEQNRLAASREGLAEDGFVRKKQVSRCEFIGYITVGERVRFLFTSCVKLTNERSEWVCFTQRVNKIVQAN